MSRRTTPEFSELSEAEAREVLARNHVGRIAYSFRGRVDVEPISYVYADGIIHGRTEPGSKLTTLAHAPWVAFEVDEVEGIFDWRSVVAHGTVYLPEADGPKIERESHAQTLKHLRSLIPETLTEDDPVPSRSVLFRLHVDTVVGRTARQK